MTRAIFTLSKRVTNCDLFPNQHSRLLNNRPDSRTRLFFLALTAGILVAALTSACLGAVNLLTDAAFLHPL